MGRVTKKFLDEQVKISTNFTKSEISLLEIFGYDILSKGKYCSQREIWEIAEILKQVEDIDAILRDPNGPSKITKTKFSRHECGELIRAGYYYSLRIFLQGSYKFESYERLKHVLDLAKKEKEDQTKEEQAISKEIKPKAAKAPLDLGKVTKVINQINEVGGLSESEAQLVSSLIKKRYVNTEKKKETSSDSEVGI